MQNLNILSEYEDVKLINGDFYGACTMYIHKRGLAQGILEVIHYQYEGTVYRYKFCFISHFTDSKVISNSLWGLMIKN